MLGWLSIVCFHYSGSDETEIDLLVSTRPVANMLCDSPGVALGRWRVPIPVKKIPSIIPVSSLVASGINCLSNWLKFGVMYSM